MADVFISYSHKAKEFVPRLHEALKNRRRKAWVDWRKIRPTEENRPAAACLRVLLAELSLAISHSPMRKIWRGLPATIK